MEKAHPYAPMSPIQPPTAPASTLLVHDGELGDVRALLDSLAIPYCERWEGRLSDEDRDARWELVLASPKRIIELEPDPCNARAIHIAIAPRDSRTLRTSLRRAGIQMMVRRPFHPAALRALIVHTLYRGPEKRRHVRVSVGATIRLRVGWRMRPAVLMDLSVGGCRLVTQRRVARGKVIRLQLPSEVSGGRALSLKARVLSCTADSDGKTHRTITTARFEGVGPLLFEQLSAAVALHERGPALCPDAPREVRAPARAARPAPPPAPPPPRSAPEPIPLTASADDAIESRTSERHRLERRVVALGEEATRVLMGRDISIGGMRIDPNPSLAVGMVLQLAVHAGSRPAPLVLHAQVSRDDGERGLVLRFRGLSVDAIRYLIEVIDELPLIDVDHGGRGCLVTEILRSEAGSAA